MKRFWKWITGDWWIPRRALWPYPEGWATYNRKRWMILDTGLTHEQAKEICRELNARK